MHTPGLRTLIAGSALMLAGFFVHANIAQADATGRNSATTPATNPAPLTPESLAAGKLTFEKYCVRCHGVAGKGGLPMGSTVTSDLTDDQWNHGSTDGELFNTIKDGIPPAYIMQPWEGQVSDVNIWKVILYIRSLAALPKPVTELQQ
jgi:mono/diheme cytochrome c family protein